MLNRSDDVDAFMARLAHPLGELVLEIRLGILRSEPTLTEQIKWNAPSFCMAAIDRVTFNLRPTDHVHLIFHRGAKPVEDEVPFRFEDRSGLLSMITKQRGQVTFPDAAAYRSRAEAFHVLVHDWVRV